MPMPPSRLPAAFIPRLTTSGTVLVYACSFVVVPEPILKEKYQSALVEPSFDLAQKVSFVPNDTPVPIAFAGMSQGKVVAVNVDPSAVVSMAALVPNREVTKTCVPVPLPRTASVSPTGQ